MIFSDIPCLARLRRRGPGLGGDGESMKGSLLLVLTLMSGLGCVWSQSEQQCPTSCECSEAARTVKCVNKNLKEVPSNLPIYVTNLFINRNNIDSLQSETFNQTLPDLSSLSLSSNHLHKLESNNVFKNLPSLRQLDLSNNEVYTVSHLLFQVGPGLSSPLKELNLSSSLYNSSSINLMAVALQNGRLSNLEKLYMSGNNLLYVPAGIFTSLPNLKYLDLSNNSLVTFQDGVFADLSLLQTLDLRHNSLKHLKNKTLLEFSSHPNLTVLLEDNSWVCDCNIEPLAKWLNETTVVKNLSSVVCSYPENMRDTKVIALKIPELDCPPYIPDNSLQTSYVFLGIVLALIGVIFLLVLYLNRKGIKKWIYNIRDACRDHMEGYHYRYEINADPRLTNLSTNSDV